MCVFSFSLPAPASFHVDVLSVCSWPGCFVNNGLPHSQNTFTEFFPKRENCSNCTYTIAIINWWFIFHHLECWSRSLHLHCLLMPTGTWKHCIFRWWKNRRSTLWKSFPFVVTCWCFKFVLLSTWSVINYSLCYLFFEVHLFMWLNLSRGHAATVVTSVNSWLFVTSCVKGIRFYLSLFFLTAWRVSNPQIAFPSSFSLPVWHATTATFVLLWKRARLFDILTGGMFFKVA